MSKLFENNYGFYISHKEFINNLYKQLKTPLEINSKLFEIKDEYKLSNSSNILDNCKHEKHEQEDVKSKFSLFMNDFLQKYVLQCDETVSNKEALATAEYVYEMSGKATVKDAYGANIGPATIKTIEGANFLFPENCMFFCKDVLDIEKCLPYKYDLILLDPPWWNKYIRRKRKKSGDAYNMLFNDEIKKIPIENLLKDKGMIVVWCTNSQQHFNDLLTKLFPKWNVKYIGKWYWMKITLNGKPVCPFTCPPGKQPYEQIIFGHRGDLCSTPFDSKVVVSVPSALHSHKPPLIELLKPILPENPSCLEIFARYLLPNWTSYGNEVLRLQHESLFV